MKKLLFIAVLGILAACKNTTEKAVSFTTYEKEEGTESPEGAPAGITLRIDIPEGESETVSKVENIIRTLITNSEIGDQIGAPKEGTLQEVCDDYVERFKKGIASEDLTPGCEYHLEILHGFQSPDYICFHVSDGIFGNGGPMERELVFRLSDGHQMEESEIIDIPADKIIELARKYAQGEQKETLLNVESLMSSELVPDENGCKLHYAAAGIYIFENLYLPLEDIKPYLTEEGLKIFSNISGSAVTANDVSDEATEVETEPETPQPAEPGRGELGIFDLRGPVKSCKWKNVYGESSTYTFNENGFWQTKDGQSIKKMYHAGIERDKTGRIVRGDFEFYDETFTYNEHGLLTETVCDGASRTITYDADGYVKSERYFSPPDMGDDEGEGEKETFNYTILEKDEMGNWTKRKSNQGTETRTITYY